MKGDSIFINSKWEGMLLEDIVFNSGLGVGIYFGNFFQT